MAHSPGSPEWARNRLHAEFFEAVGRGDVPKVREYLKNWEIDINYAEPAQGLTALHIAAARNAVAALRVLLATGKCDVSLKDHRGRTAATLAVVLGDNPVTGRYLFDRQHAGVTARAANPAKKSRDREAEAEG